MIESCSKVSILYNRIQDRVTHLVQTGLTIEQHNVTIDDMSLNNITCSKTVRNSAPVPELEIFLEPAISRRDIVGTWVYVASIADSFFQDVNIMCSHAFGVCQDLCDALRHSNFVDAEIRIRRYHSAAGEVDTFS